MISSFLIMPHSCYRDIYLLPQNSFIQNSKPLLTVVRTCQLSGTCSVSTSEKAHGRLCSGGKQQQQHWLTYTRL